MKRHQKVIVELLNASINNKKMKYSRNNNINWEKVIKEADNHKISSLVYSAIDKESLNYIDKRLLDTWRKDILFNNMTQKRTIDNICEFLNEMNKRDFNVLILKGLVLRDYYPQCDLRAMSDADILVHESDYEEIKKCLISEGYRVIDSNSVHECFINKENDQIELHWKLINKDYFQVDIKAFEESVWGNSINFKVNEVKCRTLRNEDFIIHLCIHMAVHSKYSGFGLRQLYDLGIFIKKKYDEIDWLLLKKLANKCGVLNFSIGLFMVINKIFNVEIPDIFLKDKSVSGKDAELILKNALLGGIHGNKAKYEDFSELYEYRNDESGRNQKISRFRRLMFPMPKELFPRYKYAKEHLYLLPVAWIHRLIRCLFIKYSIKSTIEFSIQSFKLGSMRQKIVKIFDL